MTRAILPHLGVAAAALVAGALFLGAALGREAMDVGVRRTAADLTPGRVLREAPPGQLVRCEFGGLSRVEVRVRKQCPPDVEPVPLALEVRRVPDGADLAAVLAEPPLRTAPQGELVERPEGTLRAFRFDAVEDSAGDTFHLRLIPADGEDRTHWAPLMTVRATRGESSPGGARLEERPIAFEFRPFHPDLSHIAFAFQRLRPSEGEVSLELYVIPDPEVVPPESFPPRRIGSGRLAHDGPVSSGRAVFRIDLEENLRFVRMRAELRIPEGTVATGRDGNAAARAFHSRAEFEDDGLLGMTAGATRIADQDLCLRVYGRGGVGANLARLREHGGLWRALVGLLLWTLATTAAVAAVRRAA